MTLDPKALHDATVAASKIGRADLGDTTPMWQIPERATEVAIETYLRETGLGE